MLKKIFTVSIILLAVVAISYAGSGFKMKDGLWEITTKMEMPGMPMPLPPMTHKQCLTKKDFIPRNSNKQQNCKMLKQKISGNTVTWEMECADQDIKTRVSGKITYKGDSFKGAIKIKTNQGDMTMTSHISGRYIGDCK